MSGGQPIETILDGGRRRTVIGPDPLAADLEEPKIPRMRPPPMFEPDLNGATITNYQDPIPISNDAIDAAIEYARSSGASLQDRHRRLIAALAPKPLEVFRTAIEKLRIESQQLQTASQDVYDAGKIYQKVADLHAAENRMLKARIKAATDILDAAMTYYEHDSGLPFSAGRNALKALESKE